MCIEPEALPASPTLIVKIPFCLCNPLILAVTNVCALVYDDDINKCDEIMRKYKEQIKKTKIIVYNLRDLMKE